MSTDRVDRILRYGAGPEFAELYHAVGRFRRQQVGDDIAMTAYARRLCECYDACEDAVSDFDAEIDRFQDSDPSENASKGKETPPGRVPGPMHEKNKDSQSQS